jgi:hypothetical protein
MSKYAVALVFLLVASGCGGSSDSAELQALREKVEAFEAQTTVAPTTTAAPTTSTTTQPPRSEQWSHMVRQPFFVGCVNGGGSLMAIGRSGVTSRNVCRCLLDELEHRFSESDFQLLSEEERTDALQQASTVCIDRLQGDYCRDRVSAECPVKP